MQREAAISISPTSRSTLLSDSLGIISFPMITDVQYLRMARLLTSDMSPPGGANAQQ